MDLLVKSEAATSASQQKPANPKNDNPAVTDQKVIETDRNLLSAPKDILGFVRPNPLSGQKLFKGTDQRSMLTLSDDAMMMKQIHATHTPDGREVEVRPLFSLVEDILNRSTLPIDALLAGSQKHTQNLEDRSYQDSFMNMLEALSFTIDRIACEIAYKALSGSDAHATTMSLCQLLSNYHWDAKLVLTLAAFALNYGEFWLLAQIYSSNQLAKSMAILKQVPNILEQSAALRSKFTALNSLIKVMMDVTRCVVVFRELPQAYISHEVVEFSTAMAHIPTAVYWTIRSAVACAAQIAMITSMSHELAYSPTESWELSTLAHKLNTIYDHLNERLHLCYRFIEEKKNLEALKMLHDLFRMSHIDNMKILKALIYAKDDIQPLVDGGAKMRRVNLEVLRRKNVLLLISSLDISQDELSILEHIYTESRQHLGRPDRDGLYELIWIPIVDPAVEWNEKQPLQKRFEALQQTMPWYSVYHPKIIQKPVIDFVKEEWHFRNKPILVVLDPQGKVVSPNAIHMMWIWGSAAFPFTSLKEETLWREERWKLDLLVNGIDQVILNWIREGRYIFLYGGDDIEWIRKFTSAARFVARDSDVPLEMVYVGKSSHREKVRKITATITVEKISHCWQDPAMVWFFWTRLHSMLFSKIQLDKADDHDDVMQGIKKLLSYDKVGGWAVLAKGSELLIVGHGSTALPTLLDYENSWKKEVVAKGFDRSITDYHNMLYGIANPCSGFDFPVTAGTGRIPQSMKCAECNRMMVKHVTFTCCHDHDGVQETNVEY